MGTYIRTYVRDLHQGLREQDMELHADRISCRGHSKLNYPCEVPTTYVRTTDDGRTDGRTFQPTFRSFLAALAPKRIENQIRDVEIYFLSNSWPPTTLGGPKNTKNRHEKIEKKVNFERPFTPRGCLRLA